MWKIIGEDPFTNLGRHQETARIGTAFPNDQVLVTLPGIHATQRLAYMDWLDDKRRDANQPPLSEQQRTDVMNHATDLIFDDGVVLIRPDPDNMPLAFQTDEMLQDKLSKTKIKFLHVTDPKVRHAIQGGGEAWRIHPLPQSPPEMERMIAGARIAIEGRPIYYFNPATGTRWLTYQAFAELAQMTDDQLRKHLLEIAVYSAMRNHRHRPEVDFFMAGRKFGSGDFAPAAMVEMNPRQTRQYYEGLCTRFAAAVPEAYRIDNPQDDSWRNHMYSALIDHRGELISEEELLGLSSEFFMQVQWLPGACMENGELIFDSVFDEPGSKGGWNDQDEHQVRGLICNLIQEYGDLEYINVGRVPESLSKRPRPKPADTGRRDVFIAQFKQRGQPNETVLVIRFQKWGVREKLDRGKDLACAFTESEEYTDYILDRRLGCQQLGMNLCSRTSTRRLTEIYSGQQQKYHGTKIWSPYFQRAYLPGIATDKIPPHRVRNPAFALSLARLLGRVAAPNMITGRADAAGNVVFDDGDEVIIEDQHGMPLELVVSDHTGTFVNYLGDLRELAPGYAEPINRRVDDVPDPRQFADVYLEAFRKRLAEIQTEYRRRRRGFDTLFRHRPLDPGGSFGYRWHCVLMRLDAADPTELANVIRNHIRFRQ